MNSWIWWKGCSDWRKFIQQNRFQGRLESFLMQNLKFAPNGGMLNKFIQLLQLGRFSAKIKKVHVCGLII